jgi:hypothetical protein
MKEVWKDIEGYENVYQVSNLGRVKSLERWVISNRGKRLVKERILKANITPNGYVVVALGIKNVKNVHRLVLETFYPIDKKMDVMHLDNDKTNNNLDNLKWGTRKENLQQMSREGRWKNQFTEGDFYKQ